MATLEVRNITKSFGATQVLRQIDLDVATGECVVLLGPSGCGKSTLLNMIAGLESVGDDEGEIKIDGHVVNNMEPKDRNIAMVFQSYALYPAMTVRENIVFGLKQRKTSKADIESALARFAKMLHVDELLDRKPAQLSGGQRQRVAMGRALVRDPRIFLFDEPLSNLDAKLRVGMRREIKKLHEQLGTTMIYVTHDQVEAMSLATRIAVMDAGIIQQIGTPDAIYDSPNSVFVADFVGSPAINLISGRLAGSAQHARFVPDDAPEGFHVPVPGYKFQSEPADGLRVIFGIRAEHIALRHGARDRSDVVEVELEATLTEMTGYEQYVSFDFFGIEIVSRLPRSMHVAIGERLPLRLEPEGISLFDHTSGLRL